MAATAALWVQPARATEFFLQFEGTGVGTDARAAEYGHPPVVYSQANGYFAFDLDTARPFGNGILANDSGFDGLGRAYSIAAWLGDDTLHFDVRVDNRPMVEWYEKLYLTLTFVDGYLASSFPSAFDPTKLISATYNADTQGYTPTYNRFTSLGSVSNLTFGQSELVGSTAFIYVNATGPAAVPEMSTWAMLLLGFGAIGAAQRNWRRQARVAPAR